MKISIQTRDLFLEFVRTTFKLRYRNSLLGFTWVLLKPFLTFLVLYVVFLNFNRNNPIQNYTLYLLLGIMMFNFFSESLTFGMGSLLEKAHIILKVNFDRSISTISSMSIAGINFLINLVVLGIFALFNTPQGGLIHIGYFLLISAIMFILMTGVAYFTSILMIHFRDLENITQIFLQLFFYATPIFYSIDILPEAVRNIVQLNPIYIFISASRDAIIRGEITRVGEIAFLAVVSIVVFLIGRVYFVRRVKRVAEFF